MEHSEHALETARELTRLLLGDEDRETTLRRSTEMCCRVMPASAMAGISLLTAGRWTTTVCTDSTVAKVDKSQYEADSGPCVDSARTQDVMRIDSTDEEKRWPEFAAAASAAGIKATISFPLEVDDETIGALNLYSPERGAFADVERQAPRYRRRGCPDRRDSQRSEPPWCCCR
jgi:GAF domain-containing protein